MKKIIIILLSLMIASSILLTACNGKDQVEYCVWTTNATQKVLQDYNYDKSSVSHGVNVSAAKNEYEGWQIILSATGKGSSYYSIEAANLTKSNGVLYKADNVKFFHQLYAELSPFEYYTEDGFYPDAILPMETAVEYKENKIAGGNNQGIYVEFFVPAEQESGIYEGEFTVKIEAKTFKVPVKLEVWEYAVSDTTTAKSVFLSDWEFWIAEKDTTQEMYNAYTDVLLEYRLSVQDLILETDHSQKYIDEFVELAYKYASNPKNPSIGLPYKMINVNIDYPYLGEIRKVNRSFDEPIMKEYIRALAKKSSETGVNILAKCVEYFNILDEPQFNKTHPRVKYVSERFTAVKEEMYNEILNDTTLSEDKITREELAIATRNIPNVVTSVYENGYEDAEIDFCPTVDNYHTQGQRNQYADNERWWYCVGVPNNPYPTYHTDDHLFGIRLLYWMMADYGISGNLNWSVNKYFTGAGVIPEDFFKHAIHWTGRPGEGFLLYPGDKYGLDRPIASLRLQAYRDGIEEYEMMQGLKTKYAQYGLDAQSIITEMGSSMYSGTQWNTSEENFYNMRQNLALLCEMALSSENEGMLVENIGVQGRFLTGKIFALKDTTVKLNGVEIDTIAGVTKTQSEDGVLYYLNVDKSVINGRIATISAVINDKERSLTYDLGGQLNTYSASDIEGALEVYNDTPITFETVDANGVGSYTGGNLIKLDMNDTGSDALYSIKLTGELVKKLSNKCKEMSIVLYTDEEIDYEISFMYKEGVMVAGRPIYSHITADKLKAGQENIIKITNLNSYNWDKYKEVTNVLITFKTNGAKTAYLKEIILSEV